MSKINIERVYKDLKSFKNENDAKNFITNLSKELLNFQERLKNIMSTLITKYYNQISPKTVKKLEEINNLCDTFEKIKIEKQLDIKLNTSEKKVSIDDFSKIFNDKLNEISLEKKTQIDNSSKQNDDVNFEDALWIPRELLSISDEMNKKFQGTDFSFIDGLKSKKDILYLSSENDQLEIVEKGDDEVFMFNGKEIDDNEFLEILKSKK